MAKYYWGLNRGQTEFQTAVGTSDPSKTVEIVVDLTGVTGTTGVTKEEVLRTIKALEGVIIKGNWPPA